MKTQLTKAQEIEALKGYIEELKKHGAILMVAQFERRLKTLLKAK